MNPPDRTIHFLGAFLLALLPGLTSVAQDVGGKGPELGRLAEAGRATTKRLESQAAAWTATNYLAGGRVIVDILAMPPRRRIVFRVEAEGRRVELLRIVERDGVWYASEGRKAGKYRPFEAPFDFTAAYLFLERAEPRCIVQTEGVALGTYGGTADGIATYRTPLTGPVRGQAQYMVDEYERYRQKDPAGAAKPDLVKTFDQLRDLLREGLPTGIRVETGMIVRFGTAEKQTEIRDFRWLDQADPEEFRVEGKRWDDFTDDPTAGGTTELLMIGHCGTWQPGTKAPDTDGRLLDLRTRRIRRIPFRGGLSLPGCFLRDRNRVVVAGLDALEGVMGLYEVDLKTGENRRLGGDLLASGFTLMPALSPDGTTIAAIHKGASGRVLEMQACLVDVASGEAKALRGAHDMAFLSWMPDGKGLVALLRESADPSAPKSPSNRTIVRLDMEGRMTKIREGDMPVVLADGETILYLEPASRAWNTCRLDGGDAKLFAGGLAGYGFPSPAPDGKRIVFMRFRPGKAPEPVILTIGESGETPAIKAPGFWTSPIWR